MPTKIRPLSNRVAVIPDAQEETSRGGIHIPSTAKHTPKTGVVFAVGPGFMVERFDKDSSYVEGQYNFPRMPMVVNVGDRVFFSPNAGTEIQINRDHFIILRESDIVAILEEKEEEDD